MFCNNTSKIASALKAILIVGRIFKVTHFLLPISKTKHATKETTPQ